jgi:hypothetical protein
MSIYVRNPFILLVSPEGRIIKEIVVTKAVARESFGGKINGGYRIA